MAVLSCWPRVLVPVPEEPAESMGSGRARWDAFRRVFWWSYSAELRSFPSSEMP